MSVGWSARDAARHSRMAYDDKRTSLRAQRSFALTDQGNASPAGPGPEIGNGGQSAPFSQDEWEMLDSAMEQGGAPEALRNKVAFGQPLTPAEAKATRLALGDLTLGSRVDPGIRQRASSKLRAMERATPARSGTSDPGGPSPSPERPAEWQQSDIMAAVLGFNADFPEDADTIKRGTPKLVVQITDTSRSQNGSGYVAHIWPTVVDENGGRWQAEEPLVTKRLRRFDGRISALEVAERSLRYLGLEGARAPVELFDSNRRARKDLPLRDESASRSPGEPSARDLAIGRAAGKIHGPGLRQDDPDAAYAAAAMALPEGVRRTIGKVMNEGLRQGDPDAEFLPAALRYLRR